VAEFDEPRGLGVVEYGSGHRLRFHCTAITDGSRRIDVGAVVAFEVSAGRLGQLEASSVRPLPGVIRPGATLTPDDEGYPGRDDRTGPVLIADPADPRATTETAGPNDLPSSPSVDFDAGPVDMVTGTGPVDMVTGTGPADTATDAGRVETRPQAPLLPTLSIRLPSDSDAGDVEPAGAAPAGAASAGAAERVAGTGEWRINRTTHEPQHYYSSVPVAAPGESEPSAGGSEGSGFFDSAPVGVERVRGLVEATPPLGTAVESDPAGGSSGTASDDVSAWPLGDDAAEPSGPDASPSITEGSPHPDFWSPFARPSSGPPPTWRTPVTKRSDPESEGD
jgi:cold shock CspA family protein